MKCLAFLVISSSVLNSVLAGHILALHLVLTGSYIKIMDSVLHTLADHHTITLYSVVHKDFPHPNVTIVPVKAPKLKSYFSENLFEDLCTNGPHYISWKTAMMIKADFIEPILNDKNMRELLHTKTKYDAMMTFTTFSSFLIQFSDVLKLPLIQISAIMPFGYVNDAIGNPLISTTQYSVYITYRTNTFAKRVQSYIQEVVAHLRYKWQYLPMVTEATSKFYPPGTASIESVFENTSLLIANMNSGMGHARPTMPNMVEVGGIHIQASRPLSQSLEEFISGAGQHGIIYFSLGSSIRSKFPDHIKRTILQVFERLPQRILWKWNEDVADLPANVMVAKWFSQQDILSHNATRLFITQAGLFSSEESAFFGVPILAIPITFDQHINSMMANDLGYCEYLDICNFSEEKFFSAIQQMLSNSKYKENAVKVSKLVKDRPISVKEHLIWNVDYVIRHRGFPMVHQLVNRSYGFKKLDVDVLLFLCTSFILSLLLGLFALYLAVKYFSVFKSSISMKYKTS